MTGCIPLTAFTVLESDGTHITGWCTTNRLESEEQQARVLSTLMQPLLAANNLVWPVLTQIADFASAAKVLSNIWDGNDGGDEHIWTAIDDRGYVTITLGIRDGAVSVTKLKVVGAHLNLTVLPDVLSQLPRLEEFTCEWCGYDTKEPAHLRLPASLADRAPISLTALTLRNSQLQGMLPREWGSWGSLVNLDLYNNTLTGTLPASWKGLSSLRLLSLELNSLSGTLPPEWGDGGISKKAGVFLGYNPGLVGTIPAAWSTFPGIVGLWETGVDGCVPDQLVSSVNWEKPVIACSQNSSEVATLLDIRKLLDPTGTVLGDWNTGNSGPSNRPGRL